MTEQKVSLPLVGSKVMLSEEGIKKWCWGDEEDPANPIGTIGEVVEEPDLGVRFLGLLLDMPIAVRWSNGIKNSYAVSDLNVVNVN